MPGSDVLRASCCAQYTVTALIWASDNKASIAKLKREMCKKWNPVDPESVNGPGARAFFRVLASSDSASRSVKHNLIVPPEPLKQGTADIALLVASNLTDAAFPVDGID
jgi:hypothetical protein